MFSDNAWKESQSFWRKAGFKFKKLVTALSIQLHLHRAVLILLPPPFKQIFNSSLAFKAGKSHKSLDPSFLNYNTWAEEGGRGRNRTYDSLVHTVSATVFKHNSKNCFFSTVTYQKVSISYHYSECFNATSNGSSLFCQKSFSPPHYKN